MHIAAPAIPEIDLFAPDLHAELARAREQSWLATSFRGLEVLTYDVCEEIFGDERFRHGASKMMDFLGPGAMELLSGPGRALLATEGTDHQALRRSVTPWFTPRRVSDLRDRTRALVDGLLDAAGSPVDFLSDVAMKIPGAVFCWMVGAPEEDGDRLAEWSTTLLKAFRADPDDGPMIREASETLQSYASHLIATKEATPGDDVTSMILAAAAREAIGHGDAVSLIIELLGASTDNTAHSAALELWLLATHDGSWERLRGDRTLIPLAVEECMRFESRVGATPVHNEAEVEMHGHVFAADSLSWLNLASAHRDPNAFEDPDEFDICRKPGRSQLSFGVGRHYCIGAALARMELQVVLEATLDRWPALELARAPTLSRVFGGELDSLSIVAPGGAA